MHLAPNHESIADPTALRAIYAHGTGGSKGLYDATVSTRPNLFNTRNRAEHARKRKLVSHTFSLMSVLSSRVENVGVGARLGGMKGVARADG